MNIQYVELTSDTITPQATENIRQLRAQLTATDASSYMSDWIALMLKSGTRIFVAMDEEVVVAVALLVSKVLLTDRQDMVENILIDEAYAHLGVVSGLMDLVEAVSRSNSARSITVDSTTGHEDIQRECLARGYVWHSGGTMRLIHPTYSLMSHH